MDAILVTISEQSIVLDANEVIPFPISFSILYDPKKIDDRNVYSVNVRVEELHSDNLLWISTWANNVLTQEASTKSVEIEVNLIQQNFPGHISIFLSLTRTLHNTTQCNVKLVLLQASLHCVHFFRAMMLV